MLRLNHVWWRAECNYLISINFHPMILYHRYVLNPVNSCLTISVYCYITAIGTAKSAVIIAKSSGRRRWVIFDAAGEVQFVLFNYPSGTHYYSLLSSLQLRSKDPSVYTCISFCWSRERRLLMWTNSLKRVGELIRRVMIVWFNVGISIEVRESSVLLDDGDWMFRFWRDLLVLVFGNLLH